MCWLLFDSTVSDKFTESMYVLANEPSVALYRLQEHVRRSLPELVQHKVFTLCHVGRDETNVENNLDIKGEINLYKYDNLRRSIPITFNKKMCIYKQKAVHNLPTKASGLIDDGVGVVCSQLEMRKCSL